MARGTTMKIYGWLRNELLYGHDKFILGMATMVESRDNSTGDPALKPCYELARPQLEAYYSGVLETS